MQDKQRVSPSLAGTPLADITSRQQQASPVAVPSLTKLAMSGPETASRGLVTPAVTGQESVEEQCLSAGRWLRGLADECLENVYTPARLQPIDTADDSQVYPETQCHVLLGESCCIVYLSQRALRVLHRASIQHTAVLLNSLFSLLVNHTLLGVRLVIKSA